jgi:hypothetical protein
MPARETLTPYFEGLDGTPLTSTSTAPVGGPIPRIGELGRIYIDPSNKRWQRVKAGGTFTQAATASNIAYWAAAHGYIVDTDLTDSEGGRNTVAGAFAVGQTLPTANQLFWILQEGGTITLNGTNVNFTANANIVAASIVGLVTCTAEATAAIAQVLGTVHTAVDRSGGAGTVVVDLNVPSRSF